MNGSRTMLGTLAAGILVAMPAACATSGPEPSATVTALTPDAQQWFKVDWEANPDRKGFRLRGYLVNTYGEPAAKVQLLAQALDAAGNVIAQRLQTVPDVVPGFGRAYFKVPNMPPADHYRVTVWSYERLEGDGNDGRIIMPR